MTLFRANFAHTVLVNGRLDLPPFAGNSHIGFVYEPPDPDGVAQT